MATLGIILIILAIIAVLIGVFVQAAGFMFWVGLGLVVLAVILGLVRRSGY